MASLMEELISVLQQENDEYKNLLQLSLRKTPVIVSADLDALAKITDEEQAIVSRLARVDKKREECMKDIATVINKDVNNLKLADLIAILSARPQEQKQLAILHDELSDTVAQMKRANEQKIKSGDKLAETLMISEHGGEVRYAEDLEIEEIKSGKNKISKIVKGKEITIVIASLNPANATTLP